jgi:uncharacterized coiled-coil protein SlyX
VTDGASGDDGAEVCERCAELEAEIARLRAQVTGLESRNSALLRDGVSRDYERPPHY